MAKHQHWIISWHDSCSKEMVGGKFFHQRQMAKVGLPVPPFFCITTDCYEEIFSKIKSKVSSILDNCDFSKHSSVTETSLRIRELFDEVAIPNEIQQLVESALQAICPPGKLLAVRGSMVGKTEAESEDSAENPFAGMSDSFLYVRKDDVLASIRRCWSSGFSPEALLYRHAQNMNLLGFATSVGIQQMVLGERSFVLFTCDPKTAARDAVIVGGYGIGEGVVQERVPVDHYFVRHADGAIESHLAIKDVRLTLDLQLGYGLKMESVPAEKQGVACFEESTLRNLVAIGKKIEELFGRPQDIEGTFDSQGNLYVLQARPVALDFRRMRVWSNSNVTESFPGTTTALTYSFARYFYAVIFYDCYRMFGIPAEVLHDNKEHLEKMIGFVKNRIYYCLSSFYQLHSLSPLFPLFKKNWETMMGFRSSYVTGERGLIERLFLNSLAAMRFLQALSITCYRYLTHERDMARFFGWWESLMGPLRGKTFHGADPAVLQWEFFRVWTQVGNNWGVTLTNDTYLPMFHGITQGLFKKWKLDSDPALLSDLLCGDENLVSVEIIMSAVRLAEQVRACPELAKLFASATAEQILLALQNGQLDKEFCRAFNKHLHDYGDRGLQELKLEQLSMRESPQTLLHMIQGYAKSDVTVEGFRSREVTLRQEAEVRLQKKLAGQPIKKLVIKFLLKRLRRLIKNRENSRYCRSELFGFSRSIFKSIGSHFVKIGVLAEASDVFHLTQEEIFGFIDGSGTFLGLQQLADLRKAELTKNSQVEPSMHFVSHGIFALHSFVKPNSSEDNQGLLRGLGSSPGVVRGKACIVLDPTSPIAVTDDLILVARETDPGWLFLMLSAKGIIVERGSMLSHTAITGRKFGIPTIVALPEATVRIPPGAFLEMDGASGVVRLLSADEVN